MRSLVAACLILTACHSVPVREPLPIRVVTVPGRTVVSLAGQGGRGEGERTLARLLDLFEEQGLSPAGLPMLVCTRDGLRHAARIPVLPGAQPSPPLVLRHVPEVRAAAVVLVGKTEAIARRFPEIERWIADHGFRAGDTRIEVRRPGENRTEVLVPVTPAGGSGPPLP